MNIVILHRYFWPQPYPYAQMLKHISEKLSSKHTVSVLTTDSGMPNEIETRSKWSVINDISIDSLPLGPEKKASIIKKVLNSIYFGLWLSIKLFFTKADVVMVATTPPVFIAMIVRWISYIRKFQYVYHCQDIHPEAMMLGGNIKKGFLYRLLISIDKKNINNAWKVITLSNDMKNTLAKRGCNVANVNIINNFIFEGHEKTLKEKREKKPISFLFAGSLGRLQNLNVLMDSISLLQHRHDIHFTFIGDGIMLREMINFKQQENLANVEFLGQVDIDKAIKAMQESEVGIVSIGENISSVAYPSKTMMYLDNGLPIFALVDEHTEIYHYINDNKIGLAIPPISAEYISNSIEEYVDNYKKEPPLKSKIKNIANASFGKELILNKHLELYS